MKNKYLRFFLFALLIIVIDQAIKLWVHFNMEMGWQGQIKVLGNFFKIHYITNPGMAFGLQLGSDYGKLFLSIFRILAMGIIAYYLYYLIKKKAHDGLLYCVAAILGGAVGNLIDSIFYGVWLNNAPEDAPIKWFHGQVVDMFFFDFYDGFLPNWIPFIGGTYYSTPIFNFADATIFCGVMGILLFQERFFQKEETTPFQFLAEQEEKINQVHE